MYKILGEIGKMGNKNILLLFYTCFVLCILTSCSVSEQLVSNSSDTVIDNQQSELSNDQSVIESIEKSFNFSQLGIDTDEETYFSEHRIIEYDFFAPSNRGERIQFDSSTGIFSLQTDDFYLNSNNQISYHLIELFKAPVTATNPFLWDRHLIFYVDNKTLYKVFFPKMNEANSIAIYKGEEEFIYRPISNRVVLIGLPVCTKDELDARYDYYLLNDQTQTLSPIFIEDIGVSGRNDDALMIIDSQLIFDYINKNN